MGDDETVLVVDDEELLADLFTEFLVPEYTVQTATSGPEALELVDENVDVILLDRRMPEMSGDEVLEALVERDIDVMVGFISGVDPDVDIVDMPFDGYLTKPVTKDEVVAMVETLICRSSDDEYSQEYFSLASKKKALESAGNDETSEYTGLIDRMNELRGKIDGHLNSVRPEPTNRDQPRTDP